MTKTLRLAAALMAAPLFMTAAPVPPAAASEAAPAGYSDLLALYAEFRAFVAPPCTINARARLVAARSAGSFAPWLSAAAIAIR